MATRVAALASVPLPPEGGELEIVPQPNPPLSFFLFCIGEAAVVCGGVWVSVEVSSGGGADSVTSAFSVLVTLPLVSFVWIR